MAASDRPSAEGRNYVFLTLEWIHRAAEAVQSARQTDAYLKHLLADYSLRVTYIVGDLPDWMRRRYEGACQAVVCVRLHRGSVREIRLAGTKTSNEADLVVNLSFDTAKNLFLGELSPARAILNRQVTAKPAAGFRRWPMIAAHSLVTASIVLKAVRKVPTVFKPTELATPKDERATDCLETST